MPSGKSDGHDASAARELHQVTIVEAVLIFLHRGIVVFCQPSKRMAPLVPIRCSWSDWPVAACPTFHKGDGLSESLSRTVAKHSCFGLHLFRWRNAFAQLVRLQGSLNGSFSEPCLVVGIPPRVVSQIDCVHGTDVNPLCIPGWAVCVPNGVNFSRAELWGCWTARRYHPVPSPSDGRSPLPSVTNG